MPFTFSHPAIVIPLSKTRLQLSLTGLTAGSMVPDFEFFFRMKLDENIGHHWLGFFVFDIPVAFFMCFVFHNVIRNTFIQHLPDRLGSRFASVMLFNWNSYAVKNKFKLCISVVIGILSHLLWDAFTHYDGVFVLMIPVLTKEIHLLKLDIAVYDVLQFISSAWGIWYVCSYVKSLPVEEKKINSAENNFKYWVALASFSIGILILRMFMMEGFQSFLNIIFASIGSIIYAMILISLPYSKLKIIRRREE
jgi:hypothetical protein